VLDDLIIDVFVHSVFKTLGKKLWEYSNYLLHLLIQWSSFFFLNTPPSTFIRRGRKQRSPFLTLAIYLNFQIFPRSDRSVAH
jgi:hypothetical protein